MLAIQSQQKVY